MVETIIAQETRNGDPLADAGRRSLETREERALALFEAYGDQIEQFGPELYWCPSQDGEREYQVRYGGQEESCTCPDFEYRGSITGRACVHLLAIGIKAAKSRARRRKSFIHAFGADGEGGEV